MASLDLAGSLFATREPDVPYGGATTGSSETPEPEVLPRSAETLLLARNCLAGPLCLAIILGNSLVIVCVFKSSSVQSFTTLLLISLCTSDLFTGGVLLPIVIGAQMTSDDVRPDWMCTFIAHVEPVVGVLSVLQILAINVDRLLCLQFPLHYHSFLTYRLLLLLVATPWVLAAAQATVINLVGDFHVHPGCVFHPPGTVPTFVAVIFFLMPFLAICVIYGFIWRIVQHHFEFAAEQALLAKCCGIPGCACLKNKPSRVFHLKITRTVAVVVGTLALSWGPYVTATMAYGYIGDAAKETLVFYVIPLAELMVFTKAALNPWVYAFWFPRFKKALSELMKDPCARFRHKEAIEISTGLNKIPTAGIKVPFPHL